MNEHNWTIRIREQGDKVVLWNETLRLKGHGLDFNSAYADLQKQTAAYMKDMKDFDLMDQIPRSKSFSLAGFFRREAEFLARHFFLGFFYIVVFLIMMGGLTKQIDRSLDRVASEYSKATASPDTPEAQRKLEKFTDDLKNLKPYIREIKKVWAETEKAPSPQ